MTATVLEIFTDSLGRIRDVGADTALLGTLSRRGSIGRDITLFFLGDRGMIRRAMDVANRGIAEEFAATWQPRDKASRRVSVQVRRTEDDRTSLRWTIVATSDPTPAGGRD